MMDFYRKIFFKESNIWLDEWLKSEIICNKLCLRSFPPHVSFMPFPSPVQKKETKQNKTNKQKNNVIAVYCIMGFLDAGDICFYSSVLYLKHLLIFTEWDTVVYIFSWYFIFNWKMGIQFCHLFICNGVWVFYSVTFLLFCFQKG